MSVSPREPPVSAMPDRKARFYHGIAERRLVWLTLGAIVLRLIIFLGRGSYVAFDEGWYMLLAENMFAGRGYTLTGLQHTTLSPLFPIVAAAAGYLVNDAVWAGRIVAAVAAGLLVIPCWHIFVRLSGEPPAWLACILIAVMPALTPFAAPYWIGWDLWVGAEPLLHLLLYSGIALVLGARAQSRVSAWVLAGSVLALAYLTRSEAVLTFAAMATVLFAAALVRRSRSSFVHALAFALGFCLTAAPYWLYLHDSLDRWALTGRMVDLSAAGSASGAPGDDAPSGIERMLWQNDEAPYVSVLYGLHPSATRLSSTYWGVPVEAAPASGDVETVTGIASDNVRPPAAVGGIESSEVSTPAPVSGAVSENVPQPASDVDTPATPHVPARWTLYVRALGTVIPWYLWPLIGFGVFGRRSSWRDELLVAVPLVLTSLAISRVVAADPRTQLFIVPLAAYYAARGVHMVGTVVDRRLRATELRPGFVGGALAAILVVLLLSTSVRWVYLGATLGSPHHLVGTANHRVGDALQGIVPADESVMSWHPAIALYADRDWRVLPLASFADIVRYASAISCEYIVMSSYYPAPEIVKDMPREYLVLHIPEGTVSAPGGWHIQVSEGEGPFMMGTLRPAAAPTAGGTTE